MHKSSNGEADIDIDTNDQNGGNGTRQEQEMNALEKEIQIQKNQNKVYAPSLKDQRLSTRIRVYSSKCEAFGDTAAIDATLNDIAPLPKDLISSGAVRRVVTDLFPRLTLSRGPITSLLVESNTASYLEFKALEASFMVKDISTVSVSAVSVSNCEDTKESKETIPVPLWTLQRVPSSKSDVFNAPDSTLGLLEKRRLMKFLLYAQDKERQDSEYAKDMASTAATAAVQRLNEKELGSGRSLLRPQNKSSSEFDLTLYKNDTFRSFLKNAACLSPSLVDLITYAVAQEDGGINGTLSAEEGMQNVCKFIGALGRFGNSAFIASLYGSGEVAQAFCRLCAVHGGLYMLRTGVSLFSVTKNEENAFLCESVTLSDGHIVKLKKTGSVLSESSFLPYEWRDHHSLNTGLVVSAICLTRCPLRLLSGSGSVEGKESDDKEKGLELVHIVVPPNTKPTLHSRVVYILQQGPGSCVVPSTHPLMRLVHISTRSESTSTVDIDAAVKSIHRTIKHLFQKNSNDLAWHVVFSTSNLVNADQEKTCVKTDILLPMNVFETSEETNMYHFENQVEQATQLIRKLFPETSTVLFPETQILSTPKTSDASSIGDEQQGLSSINEEVTESSTDVESVGKNEDDVDVEESLKLLQGAF